MSVIAPPSETSGDPSETTDISVDDVADDVELIDELGSDDQPPPPAEPKEVEGAPDAFEKVVTASIVGLCCAFVFWQLQPSLILADTTPTGGDLGAHVWGPAFLRDELLPRFQLSGWTPDWYLSLIHI